MATLQDDIRQQASAHKWLTFAIIGLIAVLLFMKFYGRDTIASVDKEVRARQDSLDVRDIRRGIELLYLQQLHTSDSTGIADLQNQLDATQGQLDVLNNKYAKIRTTLTNSSTDDKLRFLSGRLPQSGTGR